MLTKTDLQQIQKIVKTEVQQETRKIVQEETRKIVKEEVKNLVSKTDLKNELNPIKNDIIKIRKDTKIIVSFFDNEYLELRKRVERLEDHLNLPPISN